MGLEWINQLEQKLYETIEDLEREHFGLMVDKLDENHTEYENWYAAVAEVLAEIERIKYIYKKLGGTFGSEIPDIGS